MDSKITFLVTYLVHVLGDLHQPIHSISLWDRRYFPSYKGDKAGNDIKVSKVKLTKDGKLIEIKRKDINNTLDIHHIWDEIFEPNTKVAHGLPYTSDDVANFTVFCNSLAEEYKAGLGKAVSPKLDFATAKTKIQDALKESFGIAKKHGYESIKWADND